MTTTGVRDLTSNGKYQVSAKHTTTVHVAFLTDQGMPIDASKDMQFVSSCVYSDMKCVVELDKQGPQ